LPIVYEMVEVNGTFYVLGACWRKLCWGR